MTDPKPQLIYDGECGFCFYWARYWRKLTGEKVDYRPYQEVAASYPEIPVAEFQRAVQYIAPDGAAASAAEASFLTLSHASGQGFWLFLYRRLPGFAALAELAYRLVAANRPALYRVSLILWGSEHEPPRHDLVAALFLRLFGLLYLAAFVSFAVQAQGLIGSHGIMPLADLVKDISSRVGPERFVLMPMVFWANAGDTAIQTVCWAGAALSVALVCGVVPRLCLALLFILYLSLFNAGQVFMAFQWDIFLLETGFLALLMSFTARPGIWLLRWLLFRFMVMSGAVKLLSGDPSWRHLTALSYHFWTQPLPTPLAWYAARLPQAALKAGTVATFVIELGLPFLIFAPRRLRYVTAAGTLLLEACIFLTGNYNWFNLQTALLCLVLFDDAALRHLVPARLAAYLLRRPAKPPNRQIRIAVGVLAVTTVFCSLVQIGARVGLHPPAPALAIDRAVEPLHLVSTYGLFAVMTTQRDEIVIEGSDDGVLWREYDFRDKPGALDRRPPWNIPHQPRLDWQMWFAALDDPRRLPWFWHFLRKLLENEPTVTALLAHNPFPDHKPTYIRARFYSYTFATPEEHAKGQWWDRQPLGLYFPSAHLSGK